MASISNHEDMVNGGATRLIDFISKFERFMIMKLLRLEKKLNTKIILDLRFTLKH